MTIKNKRKSQAKSNKYRGFADLWKEAFTKSWNSQLIYGIDKSPLEYFTASVNETKLNDLYTWKINEILK